MAKARIVAAVGEAAIRLALDDGVEADQEVIATAVRYLLQLLSDRAPGNTVEMRVPPFGAVQCIEGPTHTRGTPPNVVETDAATWLALATGTELWETALAEGRVSASGSRATLVDQLPLRWENPAS